MTYTDFVWLAVFGASNGAVLFAADTMIMQTDGRLGRYTGVALILLLAWMWRGVL